MKHLVAMGNTYKTRDGSEVVLVTTETKGSYPSLPIKGFVKEAPNHWIDYRWHTDGSFYKDTTSSLDLILFEEEDIDFKKEYVTRDGQEVILVKITDHESYPILAVMAGTGRTPTSYALSRWTKTGKFTDYESYHAKDLILKSESKS